MTCALAISLFQGPAFADDVYLRNGNVFEGVVAHDKGDHVIVELGGGSMRLPKSRVLRIEQKLTAAQQFDARRTELLEGDAEPSEWLELANWARAEDLTAESEQLILRAADMDPDLAGLGPLMRRLGYVPDPTDGWIRESTLKRRQGFVYHGGDWITPEQKRTALELERLEQQARQAQREEQRREQELERKLARLERLEKLEAEERKAEQERDGAATDNDVALAQIDLMKEVLNTVERRPAELLPRGGFLLPSVPVFGAAIRRGKAAGTPDDTWQIMSVRQPGSLITVDQFRGTTPKQ